MAKANRSRKAKSDVPQVQVPSFEGNGVLNVKSLTFGRVTMSGVLDIPGLGKCFIETTTLAPNDTLGEISCRMVASDAERTLVGTLVLPRNREIRREAKIVMANGRTFRCSAVYQSFEREVNGEKTAVKRFKLGLPGFERPAV